MGTLMDWPKISIITPSFNQGCFLRQTIDSIISQDYPNLEYIVMDGGSTDETVGILQSYGDKIRWFSEKDNGQADAINKGLALASGDILAYINSDDYYLPGALKLVAQKFPQTGCKWLTGDYRIVDQEDHKIQSLVVLYKKFWRNFSSAGVLSLLNYIVQPSTFWSRALWSRTGQFDVSLRYTLDYDLWLRAFKVELPLVVKQPLSVFRVHKSSKGGIGYQIQFEEELQVLQRYHTNSVIIRAHRFHNALIKLIYKMIK